jgi:hypothetical protein
MERMSVKKGERSEKMRRLVVVVVADETERRKWRVDMGS